jgi:hypothetical protein
MRAVVAVRLAIRPRLRLPPEGPRRAARPRWRLPPLALPAAGYWLAMGLLTYGFTQLGPHPLDEAFASEREPEQAVRPVEEAPARYVPPLEPVTAPTSEPSAVAEPLAQTAPDAALEPAPTRASPEPSPPTEPTPRRTEQPPTEERARLPVTALPSSPPLGDFPEFSDSAPTREQDRASNGPRLDGLFERGETPPKPEEPRSPPPSTDLAVAVGSCEAAIAHNNELLELGARRGPADITREAYASILQNGSYLAGCSIPERTVFEICAAVKNGRTVGITVVSSPPSPAVNACVRRAVSRLNFPVSERLDVTHTRFNAAR